MSSPPAMPGPAPVTSRAPATYPERSRSRFEALTGLQPARFAHEEDGPGLANALLIVASVRVLLLTAGLGLAFSHHRALTESARLDVEAWQYFVIGLAYGLGLLGTLALRLGRYLRVVAYGQVIADSAMVTVLVAMTGGGDSVFAFTYVLVVLEGSLLLLRPGAWVAVGVSTAAFATVLLVQVGRVYPSLLDTTDPSNAVFGFIVQTTGTALVAFLASGLATRLRIADRQLAEREEDLERLGELHTAILGALPAGLLTIGPDGRIRFGNGSAHNILHMAPGTLVGLRLKDILPPVAEAASRENPSLDGMRTVNHVPRPPTHREIPKAPASWPGPPKPESGGPGGRSRHEAKLTLSDGQGIRLGFSLAPFDGPDGPSTIVVFQDVTEVVRLEEAVRRAEQLASVGRFAAGLAHEVRNPLASMCASIEVLDQSLQPPPALQRLMANVVKEATRLEHLIRDFLAFARPRALSFVPTDLSHLVSEVLDVFRNDAKMDGVELLAELTPGTTSTVDPDLIRQVMWNVLQNGAEAMPKSACCPRSLTVRVDLEDGAAVIEVEDEGPGFPPGKIRRVLDPFFTTKQGGSGLGLAISQSIMHAHGGEIEVENRALRGALVRLRFSRSSPTVSLTVRDLTPTGTIEVVPSLSPSREGEA